MGFLSDIFDGFFGDSDAPKDAAASQERMGREAIAETRAAREQARGDLQPFRDVGATNLDQLGQLVTNPGAQRDFIESNPFYGALADDAEQRILGNAAARGKAGSGGTAAALQNSLLLLGNDLLSQNISQRQNLATLGSNAAAGQATTTVNTGAGIANTLTGIGNAQAAGIMGSRNQKAAGVQNLVGAGLAAYQLALSDERTKDDIERIGETDGGAGVYRFRYKGDDQLHIGVLAQEVEETQPEAVVTVGGDMKLVNLARVH